MRQQILDAVVAGMSLSDFAATHGLVVASTGGTTTAVVPLSLGSDYNVPAPTVLYDPPSQNYYVFANYNWSNGSYLSDCPGTGNCGGIDGFGVRSSKQVQNLGSSAYFCWSAVGGWPRPPCISNGWQYDNSEAGVTWAFQDKVQYVNCSDTGTVSCPTYGGYNGHITFAFRKLLTGCYQFFSRYEHTWSSTSLTAFGVSYVGFSASWSNSSNHQQRTSNAGYLGCS
jgi:hypothetical protein